MATDNSLYVSRFRLFHKGYSEVVRYILNKNDWNLIIAIGAAQSSHHRDNPFTGWERAEMVISTLQEENLSDRVFVVQIDETNATYEGWTSLVESVCPPFELVYSHNELVRLLFHRAGHETCAVPQFGAKEQSFEFITGRIIGDEPWENLLPAPAVRIMKERKLEQRLRGLFK